MKTSVLLELYPGGLCRQLPGTLYTWQGPSQKSHKSVTLDCLIMAVRKNKETNVATLLTSFLQE